MNKVEAIFFDLDGTLTDPKPGITKSIQHALTELGHQPPPADDLTWCIGPPLLASFERILGDEAMANSALTLYRERFADVGLFENAVYPGIADGLRKLGESGRPLYVATSKPAVYAERIIRHFELDDHFHRVFGAELDGTRADKTDLLRFALAETGIEAAGAVMVGDRSHDIVGAHNNGMTSVGVLYGYGDRAELEEAGADDVVETVEDLFESLLVSKR